MRGARYNMAWVMPVSTVISGGTAQPGFTRVWKVPRHSPPRTLTAPISVMEQSLGDEPVVSRSSTQNVTSARGMPRSSKLRCTPVDGGVMSRSTDREVEPRGSIGDRMYQS